MDLRSQLTHTGLTPLSIAFLMDLWDGLNAITVHLPSLENQFEEAVLSNMPEVVSGILSEMNEIVEAPEVFLESLLLRNYCL